MTIRFNARWLLVPVLLFSLQFCRAQVVLPSTLSFDLGSSNAPDTQLWDLSGNYQLDVTVVNKSGSATEMRLAFVLQQDARGKLSNPTNENFGELDLGDNSYFAVAPHITGKVTGSGGIAMIHFTIRFNGNGILAGQQVNAFSGTLTVDAETDPTTGLLTGTKVCKFSANFPGLKTISGVIPNFTTLMPQGANATWNLSLQLAGLKRLVGTGIVTTPSRALGLDLSGTLKSGTATVRAIGANNVANTSIGGPGLSATIQSIDPFDSIFFKGKLLGQKLIFSFPEN
jgi:hypothetical protein